jgi:hypothetical protein
MGSYVALKCIGLILSCLLPGVVARESTGEGAFLVAVSVLFAIPVQVGATQHLALRFILPAEGRWFRNTFWDRRLTTRQTSAGYLEVDMQRPLCLSRRAARKAVRLAAALLVSVWVLPGWAIAHADPVFLWTLQGTVYVTENGFPSTKVSSVELSCQYQVFEWVVVQDEKTGEIKPAGGRNVDKTSTSSWPCQRGECPFKEELETGGGTVACNWAVRTPGGATISYPWTPKGAGPEEVRIDIAGGASAASPSSPGPASRHSLPIALPGPGAFLVALILAWLVEVPVVFLMLRYVLRPRYEDTKRLLGVAFLATLVTLPLAWYTLPFIRLVLTLNPWVYAALVETLVVAVEAFLFAWLLHITAWKAALVSMLANGLSFLIGLAAL